MTQAEQIKQFKAFLDTELTAEVSQQVKVQIFETIQALWEDVGQQPDIIHSVCQTLQMSPEFFNVCVDTPALANSLEVLSRHIKSGWLQDYLEYTANSEGPEEFHLWIGLTILAAAVRRNALIVSGKYRIYLNLYTVLVAPPGVCKKSTSAGIGINLLRDATNCMIYDGKITPESLIDSLHHIKENEGGPDAQCLMFSSEMGNMFGDEKYLKALLLLLTDLYDCPSRWTFQSKRSGRIPLNNVCVTLIACTTPEQLPNILSSSVNEGGPLSRLVTIYKTKTPRCFPVPKPETDRERELRARLVDRLHLISTMEPMEFSLTPQAEQWYDAWYRGWKRAMEESEAQAYAARHGTLILKTAMLLGLSERKGPKLDEDVLRRANNLVSEISESTRKLLSIFGSSQLNGRPDPAGFILRFIDRNGGNISRPKLQKQMLQNHMYAREMNPALQQLEEAGMIRSFQPGGEGTVLYYMKVRKGDD